VPVDGMSAEDAFNELYAAWHITKGGPANQQRDAHAQRYDQVRELRGGRSAEALEVE